MPHEAELTDAMEAVLEDALRMNIILNREIDQLKLRLREAVGSHNDCKVNP